MNDDRLILYYYGDGLSEAERDEIAAQLATDPDIADRYRQLTADLDAVDTPPPPPLPDDMLQRFHAGLERAAAGNREDARVTVHPFSFFWGAAVTAALAVGIAIGVWVANDETAGIQDVEPLAATTPLRSEPFVRGLRTHFRASRAELANLDSASAADRILLVAALIEQNRLFARAAEHNDSHDLARVLRAFEPVLTRLASEDIAPADAEALRTQLAFELDVMLTKLARESSIESGST